MPETPKIHQVIIVFDDNYNAAQRRWKIEKEREKLRPMWVTDLTLSFLDMDDMVWNQSPDMDKTLEMALFLTISYAKAQ